jgi:hypothetical protein
MAPVGHYFSARGRDLLDIFEVSVHGGKGARLDVRYGIGMFGGGIGAVQGVRLGQRSLIHTDGLLEAAPIPGPLGVPLAAIAVLTIDGATSSKYVWAPLSLVGWARDEEERMEYVMCVLLGGKGVPEWPKSFQIGAEITLGVGVRARIYPVELLDFLAGLFGYDPAKDDAVPYEVARRTRTPTGVDMMDMTEGLLREYEADYERQLQALEGRLRKEDWPEAEIRAKVDRIRKSMNAELERKRALLNKKACPPPSSSVP